MHDEFEAWDAATVDAEVSAFSSALGGLIGRPAIIVRTRFGAPDAVRAGSRVLHEDGSLQYQADEELGYFGLIPHVSVWFSIADTRVHHVWYTPKWRKCPADARDSLGHEYAPD